jgi:hypothetical protein
MLVIAGVFGVPLSECATAYAEDPPPPDNNERLVAFTVMFEATNQPKLGQQLVAHVVVNRARKAGTEYYEHVVFQPGQFAAWTHERKMDYLACQVSGDEECFHEMVARRLGTLSYSGQEGLAYYLAISAPIVGGEPAPPDFEGALYFDNPAFWPDGEPPWAKYKVFLGCVADHCFWK